jgi:hypothetical protein
MYLRRCYRKKDGKRHGYWALVESYRTARGPRQRMVAYLGEVDECGFHAKVDARFTKSRTAGSVISEHPFH